MLLSEQGVGGKLGDVRNVSSYPLSSVSMTSLCRPVETLQPGMLGEPTRSVGEDSGAPVGLVRATFTSLRIRTNGPSLVAVF